MDAPSLVYRALFSTPDTIRAPGGEAVNAVHGFLGMLARLVTSQAPDALACADDADWRPAWRVALIPSYKAHRTEAESPAVISAERLAPQLPILWSILGLCGVPVVGQEGFEAEDVIGTLAARCSGQVAIFSGDRDLFQLVADPDVRVLYPRRGTSDMISVDEAYVTATYGIPGRSYADYAVLRGDSSDGLPGVRGIGDKTAAALIAKHGTLQAVLDAADAPGASGPLLKVRRDRDYVQRSADVVRIRRDLPIPGIDLRRRAPEGTPELWELAEHHGLSGAVTRLLEALS